MADVVELLLANGAEVNAKDKEGDAPLHAASRSTKGEAVELLLANGADIDAKNNRTCTPLGLVHSELDGILRPTNRSGQRDLEQMAELLRQHGGHA